MAGRLKIYNDSTSTWEYIGGYGKTMPAGDVVGTSDTQTLTNKTLTNPAINYTDSTISITSKARAYNTAAQSMTGTAFTKVTLNAESYDVGGDFDAATNYRFIAPVTGYYLVNGRVLASQGTAGNTNYKLLIYKDGVAASEGMNIVGITYPAVTVTDIIYLEATNYVELYFRNNNANAVNTEGGINSTYFAVHLLSI